MKVLKAILNTIINILIVMILVASLLIAVMALTSRASGISTVFGYTVQTIQSDSMKGVSPDGYEGGNFEDGDLIIGKSTGYSDSAEYQLGDIVTFRSADSEGNPMLIVHRIVDKIEYGDSFLYQTWGDNREIAQVPDQTEAEYYLYPIDIGSVFYSEDYHGVTLKGVGRVLDFVQTQLGFFLVVLLPMIAFFLYELIRVVLNATKFKKEKYEEEKEEAVKAAESDKQAAIDAAVAEALRKRDEQAAAEASARTDDAPVQSDFPQMSDKDYEEFKQFQAFKKMQENKNDE